MRTVLPVFLCVLVLVAFAAGRSYSQATPEARFQIVGINQGPFVYRLNVGTGEVCAIKAFRMDYAWKPIIGECADTAAAH